MKTIIDIRATQRAVRKQFREGHTVTFDGIKIEALPFVNMGVLQTGQRVMMDDVEAIAIDGNPVEAIYMEYIKPERREMTTEELDKWNDRYGPNGGVYVAPGVKYTGD